MRSWQDLWTKGSCGECRKKGELYKGLCRVCRHPKDQREMIQAGIPCSTAGILVNLVKKCNGNATLVLTTVHPILMENLVVEGKALKVLDKGYEWHRRHGWFKK